MKRASECIKVVYFHKSHIMCSLCSFIYSYGFILRCVYLLFGALQFWVDGLSIDGQKTQGSLKMLICLSKMVENLMGFERHDAE